MNFIQLQAYSGFWAGTVVMISTHNMFVSFFLYKARQTNMSNILKIIFNFGNIIRFAAVWGTYMTPTIATMLQCVSLGYIQAIGNVLVRISLTAFLLWRLKQINNLKLDNWVGIILLSLRAGFGLSQLGLQRPITVAIPGINVVICDPNEQTSEWFLATGIGIELVVDLYVTARLVQVLRQANRNAAQISSNMVNKSKRTLFTAVMYWNFLRLFVSLLFHLTPILNYTVDDGNKETRNITLFSTVNILLSYVITVDAEIVRVIEGKGKRNNSSAGSEKSSKMSQSPRTPRHGYSSSDLPKYSPQSFNETQSQIDGDKIAIVSMKRLSFFEWANVVVGKRIRRNNNNDDDEQQEEENAEEIIEVPSEVKEEADIEQGISEDRRNSNFSGTTSITETSTLDGNPDIIIK